MDLLRSERTFERGFRLLMGQYKERLYWHIRRLVLVHEDADDVLQNTFIKIYRGILQFEGKSRLYTWLYRIATNEAITYLQSKARHAAAPGRRYWRTTSRSSPACVPTGSPSSSRRTPSRRSMPTSTASCSPR